MLTVILFLKTVGSGNEKTEDSLRIMKKDLRIMKRQINELLINEDAKRSGLRIL